MTWDEVRAAILGGKRVRHVGWAEGVWLYHKPIAYDAERIMFRSPVDNDRAWWWPAGGEAVVDWEVMGDPFEETK